MNKIDKLRSALEACDCCGGWIPLEDSAPWRAAEGTCPGRVTPRYGMCGAFDEEEVAGELTRTPEVPSE